jgi:hypothetical protein
MNDLMVHLKNFFFKMVEAWDTAVFIATSSRLNYMGSNFSIMILPTLMVFGVVQFPTIIGILVVITLLMFVVACRKHIIEFNHHLHDAHRFMDKLHGFFAWGAIAGIITGAVTSSAIISAIASLLTLGIIACYFVEIGIYGSKAEFD